MLVALGRGERIERRIAAQSRVAGEQHPPFLALPHQDGPVGRRLVRAPYNIDPGLPEAQNIRMQKLLEAFPFRESPAEPGVPVRFVAEEPRGSVLAQASDRCLSKDRPAVAVPALGIEQINVQRMTLCIQKQITAIDREILKERRKRERHLGPHPAADQRKIAPAPVDLAENAEAPAVGGPHQDEPAHGERRRKTARLGFRQRNATILREIAAQVGPARLADQIDLQPVLPLHPPKLLQLPAQNTGAFDQVPPPVIVEEEETLSRPRRLQTPLHISGPGEKRPDRSIDRLVNAKESDLLDRRHGLEDRQARIFVHGRKSQAVRVILGPQQVPAEPPGDLVGLGVLENDAGDARDEDDGDGGGRGRWVRRQGCGPRATGAGQESNQETKCQSGSSPDHLPP
jgi:hypothetical protein